MNSQNKPNRVKVIIFVSMIAVLLLGSIGATGVAAKSAIPGDALYSLKTTVEQTQLRLSNDAAYRAQLKINFAEERLEEIGKLVEEGRYFEIKETVLAFESSINGALIELEEVTKSDPTTAAQLATDITAALSKYAEVLTNMASSVPEVIQSEVNRALESALLAGSLDLSSDDNDNDDFDDDKNSNDDDDDMNSNDNDDDDMNSNDNDDDDMNSNDNDDDDMNSNDDDDDDDMNSNDDDDDDMNSNDDDDDDMNSNDDDDDDMNSNDNDDDDMNSNDDDDDDMNSNDDDNDDMNDNDDYDDDDNDNDDDDDVDDNENENDDDEDDDDDNENDDNDDD